MSILLRKSSELFDFCKAHFTLRALLSWKGLCFVLLCNALAFFFFTFTLRSATAEHTLRIPLMSMPLTFDPIKADEYFTNLVNRNIFETLIRIEDSYPVSVLADIWYPLTDNHFVIRIRDDVHFSSGFPMTASDVIKSMNRALDHPLSRLKDIAVIDSVRVVDRVYLHIHHQSYDSIITFFSELPIFKAELLVNLNDKYLSSSPIGTGEYFAYILSPDKIVLKKNRLHRNFKKNRELASVVELLYEPDLETQYMMLKNNQVDLLLNVPVASEMDVFSHSDFRVFEKESNKILYKVLDTRSVTSNGIDLPVNPLRDRNVRQAMAYALDMDEFIQSNLFGRAHRLVIPTVRNLRGYPYRKNYYGFNRERGLQLMATAGFSEGFDMTLRITECVYSGPLSEFLKESLKTININLIIEHVSLHEFDESIKNDPPSAYIGSYFSSNDFGSIVAPIKKLLHYHNGEQGYLNRMRNANSYISSLTDSMYQLFEFDRRKPAMFQRLSTMIYDEVLIIPFFQVIDLVVMQERHYFNYTSNFLFSDIKIGR